MSWTHKGIEININEYGSFEAEVRGQKIKADTLEFCKKKVEKALKSKIKRVKLYKREYAGYSEQSKIVECIITSVSTTKSPFSGETNYEFWITEMPSKSRGKFSAQNVLKPDLKIINEIKNLEKTAKELNDKAHKLEDSIKLNEKELLKMLGFKTDEKKKDD